MLPFSLRTKRAVLGAALALSAVVSHHELRASASGVVISEFRVRGPVGGNDEFIELYNAGSSAVSIGGWKINGSNAAGTTSTRLTITAGVVLNPGCFYLATNSAASGYSGAVAGDQTYATGITDDGGLALLTAANAVVDAVGMSAGSAYKEGTPLASLGSSNLNRGYERRPGGSAGHGVDTDDNASDFVSITPSQPQSSASPCISSSSPTNPGGTASVNPATADPGDAILLTVAVSPGSNPSSTGVTVAADLTPIGGASGQPLFDDGSNGDVTPGDLTFSLLSTIDGTTAPGLKTLNVTIADAQGRTGAASTTVNVSDPTPPLFEIAISQVYGGGGNSGATYTHDFIELFNRGTEPVNLAGWSVQYAGATNDGSWQVTPLSGTIQPGRYYLVQQAAGNAGTTPLPAPDATGGTAMSATNGKVALFSTTTAFAGACPAGGALVDLIGFGTANCREGSAAAAGLTNTTAALRKRGGCFDSNENAQDFSIGAPAPRNSAAPVRSCSFQTAPIHTIQGDGLITPFNGQDVTTSGIVTVLKSNGFFVQSPDASVDADPMTSEGLFVFTSTAPAVSPGDLVTIRGTAAEFFELTQIEATLPGAITVTTSGHPLPAAVVLTTTQLSPSSGPRQLEPLEGMRVAAPALVSVAPTNNFGEIHAVLSGVPRPMREPGIEAGLPVPPDPMSGQVDCCIPIWDRNPERIMIDSDGAAGASPLFVTSNVTLTGVTGPLDFAFGDYKILPEAAPMASANMTPLVAPAPTAHEFTVASYNIENFANDERQRRKAALHIRTVMRSPDIIGTVEIASLPALEALAAQVNADAVAAGEPSPQYEARLIAAATGTQHLGFLVRTSRVLIQSVTQQRAGDTFINPVNGQPETLHDRPPLVLDAIVDPAGDSPARVLVVVNHLRSFIDIELVGGEGPRVRAKRTAQAEAVAELLQELQSTNPGALVIAVGDYNAYEFNDGYTDPLSILKGAPTPDERLVVPGSPDLVTPDFVNLTDQLSPDQRYTYIFEGTPQAIDHVLVNPTAARYVQRYVIARSNTDFPESNAAGLFLDPSRPEANSDHDTPIAYFSFPGRPVVTLNGDPVMTVEAFTTFVDPGATAQDDDGPLAVTVSGAVDVTVPGSYTLRYTAQNAHASTTVERTVIVADTIAPAISAVVLSPSVYTGPPNHKMFTVIASYAASDAAGAVTCGLSVTSNEPVNGAGDGNTDVDWIVLSPTAVQLRAERSGRGNGRVYTVTASCSDPSGNSASRSATVLIRK